MITLRGLILTIATTRNFWSAVALKVLGGRRDIAFRNGFRSTLAWPEYMTARALVRQGFALEAREGGVVCRRGDMTIAGTLRLLGPLAEDPGQMYDADCRGKIVLDIGGCVGETAVHFTRRGAAKVIVYEPSAENQEYLNHNCAVNGVNAEIHDEGVGPRDEVVTVNYENLDGNLGVASKGSRWISFKLRNLADVISTSGADVAKLDCEGGEQALVDVPPATLRMIETYMIEAHGHGVRDALVAKFAACGFEVLKDRVCWRGKRPEQYLGLLTFRRLPG